MPESRFLIQLRCGTKQYKIRQLRGPSYTSRVPNLPRLPDHPRPRKYFLIQRSRCSWREMWRNVEWEAEWPVWVRLSHVPCNGLQQESTQLSHMPAKKRALQAPATAEPASTAPASLDLGQLLESRTYFTKFGVLLLRHCGISLSAHQHCPGGPRH